MRTGSRTKPGATPARKQNGTVLFWAQVLRFYAVVARWQDGSLRIAWRLYPIPLPTHPQTPSRGSPSPSSLPPKTPAFQVACGDSLPLVDTSLSP